VSTKVLERLKERFAEGIHRHRDVFDFLGEGHRPPELSKIIAAERSRPDLHDVVPTEFARLDHRLVSFLFGQFRQSAIKLPEKTLPFEVAQDRVVVEFFRLSRFGARLIG
jgi:hypothetical protein